MACYNNMLRALQIMHIVGYVHRDVSAGNVLYWNSIGLLSDLESDKKKTDLSTHEVRTVRLISHHVLPTTPSTAAQ
jgi:serine/threonine-protein kinase RIO1